MAMEFEGAFDASRTIKHGWWAFKQRPIALFFAAMLAHCGEGGGSGNTSGSSSSDTPDIDIGDWGQGDMFIAPLEALGNGLGLQLPLATGMPGGAELGVIAAVVFAVLGCGCLFWIFKSWWNPGYIRLQHDAIAEGKGGPLRLFSGGDKTLSFMGYGLLSMAIILGIGSLAATPGGLVLAAGAVLEQPQVTAVGGILMAVLMLPAILYVHLGLVLAPQAMALDGLGTLAAVSKSWKLMSGNRFQYIWFSVVCFLYALFMVVIGLLACLIGVLFTVHIALAVIDTAKTEAYLLLTRDDDEVDTWNVWEALAY